MRILVTRPRSQATQLVADLESAGYQADCLPLLDIVPAQLSKEEENRALNALRNCSKLVAVSANAARLAIPYLKKVSFSQPVFCIGPSTSQVFEQEGFKTRIPEGNYNSESLLQLPDFLMESGQTVTILCGQGGREYLEEKLAEKGAAVCRIELYSRRPQAIEALDMEGLDIPDALTAMSGDTAEALARALDLSGRVEWKALPLVVSGDRVRGIAERLGFKQVIAAEKPTTEGLIDILEKMQKKPANTPASGS